MIPKFNYKDKYGNIIDLMEWAKLFENTNYRTIAQDDLGKYRVSTIWCGIPRCPWSMTGCFETMVFPNHPHNFWKELDLEVHNTIEQATIKHVEMVNKWKEKIAKGETDELD